MRAVRGFELCVAVLVASTAACEALVDVGNHALRPSDAGTDSDAPSTPDATAPDATADTTASEAAPESGAPDAPHASDAALPPNTLASGLQAPSVITLDDTNLYWIAAPAGGAPGAVLTLPKDGGAAPTVLAGGLTGPVGLRSPLDDGFVYFTAAGVGDAGTGMGLYKVAKTGAAVLPVALSTDGMTFGALAATDDATFAYTAAGSTDGGPSRLRWTDRSASDGGGQSCYVYATAPGGTIPSVVATETTVIFADTAADAILWGPVGCSGTPTLLSTSSGTPLAVSFIGTYVFWLTSTTVWRLDVSTSGSQPLAVASGLNGATAMSFPSSVGAFVVASDGTVSHVLYPSQAIVESGLDGPSSAAVDMTTTGASYGTGYIAVRGGGEILVIPP